VIRVLVVVIAAGLLASGHPPARPAGEPSRSAKLGSPAPVAYSAPLPAPVRVIHPFAAPSDPYAAGERGVDLASRPGEVVRAAGRGVVSFAGSIAGHGVVVLRHPDGISTEYEPVDASVRAGATVSGGQPIGTVSGTHPGCAPGRCLHWGARRAGVYLDPMSLLQPLGVVRLLPWTG
jgi:murein DD-endopeptidase MepM/ murein hydrolase activator NlpD